MRILLFILCLLLASAADAQPAVTKPTTITILPSGGGACPASSGNGQLILNAIVSRSSGIAPLEVWFDATGSTDTSLTGLQTVVQDVTFTWTFGDGGASGTAPWLYGNPVFSSRNTDTGIIAAHLYNVAPGAGDPATSSVAVTAKDPAGNTASCTLAVNTFDPVGANGFTTKVCQSASGNFAGCPVSATHSTFATEGTNLGATMTNKLVLFHCGESYSGAASFGGNKFSIGAYGGCEGTQTNRPIFSGALSSGSGNVIDGRISDIDFESAGSVAVSGGSPSAGSQSGPMTLWNLKSSGNTQSYLFAEGQQWALVQVVMTSMVGPQGIYLNYAAMNCFNGSTLFQCGQGAGAVYNNVNYIAMMGSNSDGTGATTSSNGIESTRMSGCRLCVFNHNRFANANNTGATLKFHQGNGFITKNQWVGQATEWFEIADNEFTGQSGAACAEIAPQNGETDEHIQNGRIERNYLHACVGQMWISAHNIMLADNVFNGHGAQFSQRGSEFTPSSFYPCANGPGVCPGSPPVNMEAYNNTFVGTTLSIATSPENSIAAGNNSIAKNNLLGTSAINNGGTGNTISNNGSPGTNPGFTNPSGNFTNIGDYKPTTGFSGGVAVPVQIDALGVTWSPTWFFGAVHP